MLLTIVILFAVLWLPYRAWLVYNSLATRSWLNIWYLLFAKTCIYLNSAINPLLYNAMSKKFRIAFVRTIFCYESRGRTGKLLTQCYPLLFSKLRKSTQGMAVLTRRVVDQGVRGMLRFLSKVDFFPFSRSWFKKFWRRIQPFSPPPPVNTLKYSNLKPMNKSFIFVRKGGGCVNNFRMTLVHWKFLLYEVQNFFILLQLAWVSPVQWRAGACRFFLANTYSEISCRLFLANTYSQISKIAWLYACWCLCLDVLNWNMKATPR